MIVEQIFEPKLSQYTYLIGSGATGEAIIVDPMRDIDRYLTLAEAKGLRIVAAAETHIHADYVTGLREFAESGILVYASAEGGSEWQYEWLRSSTYDYQLLTDQDSFAVGDIHFEVRHTPGHTSEHLIYLVTDLSRDEDKPLAIVSGDFLFVGDVGRPDLLESAVGQLGTMAEQARVLYDSIDLLRHLPADLVVWPGHGAGSACGKALGAVPMSSLGYELATNPSVAAASDAERFVSYITADQPEPPPYFARCKELNRKGPPVLNGLPIVSSVLTDEIATLVADESVQLIDTRDWETFISGHLPRSLFIPTTSAISTLLGSYVDPTRRAVLIAHADDVEDFARHGVRVGVDGIDGVIYPDQFEAYVQAGGTLATLPEQHILDVELASLTHDDTLVDVRRSAELRETGTLAGSINISHSQVASRSDELPDGKHLIVYCRTGNRSRYAAALMASRGWRVTNLGGGIVDWIDRNLPVESR